MTRPERHIPMCDCGADHQRLVLERCTRADDGCWNWNGRLDAGGYAHIGHDHRSWMAHRFSYSAFSGPFSTELQIDHLCKNRACVNPEHLEPVTRRENILRSSSFSANYARRQLCARGHELTPALTPRSRRRCLVCQTARRREWIARNPPLPPNDPRHGTLYGYQSFKCRCDDCIAASKRRDAARSTPRPVPEHGTHARYRRGCRCVKCKAANAAKARARRKRRLEEQGYARPTLGRPARADEAAQ